MAHEMVHLKLYKDKSPVWDKHGPEFEELAYAVANTMGWDHLEF
jgi:predicted SprT family Zn-dependent metalloprotease